MLGGTIGCTIEVRLGGVDGLGVAREVEGGGLLVQSDAHRDVVVDGELVADNGGMAVVGEEVKQVQQSLCGFGQFCLTGCGKSARTHDLAAGSGPFLQAKTFRADDCVHVEVCGQIQEACGQFDTGNCHGLSSLLQRSECAVDVDRHVVSGSAQCVLGPARVSDDLDNSFLRMSGSEIETSRFEHETFYADYGL